MCWGNHRSGKMVTAVAGAKVRLEGRGRAYTFFRLRALTVQELRERCQLQRKTCSTNAAVLAVLRRSIRPGGRFDSRLASTG